MSTLFRIVSSIALLLSLSACGTLVQYRQEAVVVVKVSPLLISTDNAYSQGVIDMQEYEMLQRRVGPACEDAYRTHPGEAYRTTQCTSNDKYFVNAVEVVFKTSQGTYLTATYKANRSFSVGQKAVISVFNDLVLK